MEDKTSNQDDRNIESDDVTGVHDAVTGQENILA